MPIYPERTGCRWETILITYFIILGQGNTRRCNSWWKKRANNREAKPPWAFLTIVTFFCLLLLRLESMDWDFY